MWNQIAFRTKKLASAVRPSCKPPTLCTLLPHVLPSSPFSPRNFGHTQPQYLHTHSLASYFALFHIFYYRQGSNLSRNAVAVVAAMSTVFTILFVVLAVLGKSFLLSAAGAAIFVITIIVYLVGASKLAKSVGRNPTGLRVVTLTRQVAVSLIFSILVQLSWVVVGNRQERAILPLRMIITNLLMPITVSAPILLLLRFISRSFTRIGTERSARKARSPQSAARSTKASATVAPATDFTATSSATSGAMASH